MLSDPSLLYYGAMGVAVGVCFVAGFNYLRLATQLAQTLNEHSLEWRQIKAGAGYIYSGWLPIRRLDAIILSSDDRKMLPSDPSVQLVLRQARIAGGTFLIGLAIALVCLGAADAGTSRYR